MGKELEESKDRRWSNLREGGKRLREGQWRGMRQAIEKRMKRIRWRSLIKIARGEKKRKWRRRDDERRSNSREDKRGRVKLQIRCRKEEREECGEG